MKKIGILMLALVLALGALGIGYAQFSETLTVDGIVNTGTINPYFANAESNDGGAGGNQLDPDETTAWTIGSPNQWPGNRKPKDIGITGADISTDGNQVLITADNTYPSYYSSVLLSIKNAGSVPAHVYGIQLVSISKGGVDMWTGAFELLRSHTYYIDLDTDREFPADENLDPGDDFSLHISYLEVSQQLDPEGWPEESSIDGHEDIVKTLYIDIDLHVEDGAEQDTMYDFTIELLFDNWN